MTQIKKLYYFTHGDGSSRGLENGIPADHPFPSALVAFLCNRLVRKILLTIPEGRKNELFSISQNQGEQGVAGLVAYTGKLRIYLGANSVQLLFLIVQPGIPDFGSAGEMDADV